MLIEIITQILIPVFLLMGVGALVNRFLALDLTTLNRLTFHVLAPGIVFLKLAETELDVSSLGIVAGFSMLHLLIMMAASWWVFSRGAFRPERPILVMGAIFYNAGNYGFPLAQLAFGDFGVSVMAIILAVQIVTNFTFGLWLVGVGQGSWKTILKEVLRVPLIYTIVIALLVNMLDVTLPQPIYLSLKYLGDGLIPVALLSLGMQLARTRAFGRLPSLAAITVTRLLVSPLLAVGMAILAAPFLPPAFASIAPVLVVGLGLPVAVNAYVIAAEYNCQPEFASQSIFWTTILSAFTLTLWLALYHIG